MMTTSDTPSADKPTDDWVTGEEAITGPQKSYLKTLLQEAGRQESVEQLTKAEASDMIEKLQAETGRGDG